MWIIELIAKPILRATSAYYANNTCLAHTFKKFFEKSKWDFLSTTNLPTFLLKLVRIGAILISVALLLEYLFLPRTPFR